MESATPQTSAAPSTRLQRLLGYVEADPGNPALIGEAAQAAADAACFAECDALLAQLEQLQPLSPALMNLRGLSALSQGCCNEAWEVFSKLHSAYPAEPFLTYNLAYANALLGKYEQALALLDDSVLYAQPDTILLKIQCMHHLGMLEEAIELGKQHSDHPVAGTAISGMLATLFFDADDSAQAQAYAMRAPDSSGGLTVLGLLALEQDDRDQAQRLFGRALETDPRSGRAHLGQGLGSLAQHDFPAAAASLDRAAALLQNHAGTWLSAGWAHLLDGKLDSARERFQQAFEIDRGFAEAIGALAVTDVYQQRYADAERHAETALRLDRECLSAVMAQSLLLAHRGDKDKSHALQQVIANHPLGGESGPSIAEIVAKRALRDASKH